MNKPLPPFPNPAPRGKLYGGTDPRRPQEPWIKRAKNRKVAGWKVRAK